MPRLTGSRQSLPIGKPCGSFYLGEETMIITHR